MAVRSKKRKTTAEEEPKQDAFIKVVNIEMLSDEEGPADDAEDDGEVDEFPELDADSDSDSASEEDEPDVSDEEDSDSDEEHDLTAIHLFPKAKKIISDITGQPKLIYPEIEPDYDSDSSTEDVSMLYHLEITLIFAIGSQSRWKCPYALV